MADREKIRRSIIEIYRANPKMGLVELLLTLDRDLKHENPREVAAVLNELIAVR